MSETSPPTAAIGRRRRQILGARAQQLARSRTAPAPVAFTTCIVCETGGMLYAIPLARTKRVAPFRRAAPIPTAIPALLGVIVSAGVFYHVYDLDRLVGAGAPLGDGHVVLLRGISPCIAIRADRVLGVADLVELAADASSRMRAIHPAVTAFVRPLGVDAFDGRTISLLDPDQLTSSLRGDRSEGDQRVDQ